MRTRLFTAIAALVLLSPGELHAAAQQQVAAQPAAPKPIPVADFVRDDSFQTMKISPTGEFVARAFNIADKDSEKTVLVIQNRSDGKITGHFNLSGKTQVEDFWWVNDKRLVISVAQKFGLLDKPQATGELYAANADGTDQLLLIGARVNENNIGSHITTGKATAANGATMVDTLRNDARHVVVEVWPKGTGVDAFTKAALMDVNTGQIAVLANAPVQRAGFITDLQGGVRFAEGSSEDNKSKMYYRDGANSSWVLLNDETVTHVVVVPLGFAADGHTAYLQRQDAKEGPDTIVAYDTVNHTMRDVLRDPVADPSDTLEGPSGEILGVRYMDAKPRVVFFDETSALAKSFRSLEASFPDQTVFINGYTSDGKRALVVTYSDRSPGDYYLFDLEQKKAAHLLSHRDWIDPDRMGEQRPIALKARDGTMLHGFLTLPAGSVGRNLPLVVNPHGGPIDIADEWGFNGEVQLLASRGYAVLQVNYRGSSGFGRAFTMAGYKQWGGIMQDDVTDATRWAIAQGIADSHRVCIYGASFGAYSALMGVAKEPSMYRCAIGYVGWYDLESVYHTGDVQDSHSGTNYLKEAMGEQGLDAISPTHLADRITVPVMLAAGREDKRAPPIHTEKMRDALQHAGKQVQATIYDGEGHGFFLEADRESFYNHMLDFLDHNIGAGAGGH